MTQIPILSGIYTDSSPDFRTSYPINMRPVPKVQGISQGYLRTNEGALKQGEGPGFARGGIQWRGVCYRVMGTKLVSVSKGGKVSTLADVGGSGTVSFAYSFNELAIASGGKLFYWDQNFLTEVTDPDLLTVLDVTWVDGYFITTDGEFLVATDLDDPTSINPIRYGSSEVDPDPVVSVLTLRNELYAVNRHSIETFQNIGGTGFPFQVVRGAQVHRGAVGTHAAVVFNETIAFLGSGRNEAPAVWIGNNGVSQKISTREIDEALTAYTEAQLSEAVLEVQVDRGHNLLMMHLPSSTWCYDSNASAALQTPVWYELQGASGPYPVRHFVWANDQWMVASAENVNVGISTDSLFSVWGDVVNWQFGTPIVYNQSKGGIFHELELVALGGVVPDSPGETIYTQYSLDGATWSQKKYISAGLPAQRDRRLRWMRNGRMSSWRIQRFGGNSETPISAASLEARIEGLAW